MKNILILICLLGSLGLHGQKKLMIDPGHGYTNGDSTQGNPDGRTYEEVYTNFAVSQKLYDRLKNCSAVKGYQTTTGRKFISLAQRVQKSNNYQVDRFLSVHCNASAVCCGDGTETFYYRYTNATGKDWSQKVQNRMVQKGKWKSRGIKPGGWYVVRKTNAYACLSEIGFVDNSSNRVKLLSNWWRGQFAYAYELAMTDDFGLSCSGGGGGGGTTGKPGSFKAYASARCYKGNNYSRVTWTKSAGAAGYKIYRNGKYYAKVGANKTSYNNWAVGNGGTHWKYQVLAYNSKGSRWNSNGKRWATAKYCNGSNTAQLGPDVENMQDEYAATQISIAPNPVGNTLEVYGSNVNTENLTMEVYDLMGRAVVSQRVVDVQGGEANIKIDVENLPSGVYILRCTSGEEVFDQKFTKQ